MKTLLHPTYFPNVATFATLVQTEVIWEVNDNFQKQTFRSRTYICTDLGKHFLSLPIAHVGGNQGRQKYADVRLKNEYRWQRQHWRTLQTAYRTSPFFEYYEDDLAPLFEKEFSFLLDFNLKTIATICECIQTGMPTGKTNAYVPNPQDFHDARFLVNAKKDLDFAQKEYVQVFGERHGFIKNTSVLDLLFNEGTNALRYLKQQDLKFLNV